MTEGDPTAQRLVGLLATNERRRVVAALTLAEEPIDLAAVAATAGISLRQAADALDRLSSAGLVGGGPEAWQLDHDMFARAARAQAPVARPSAFADEPDDVARVLSAAFRDGELVQWPTKRSRRMVVLDYLAQRFEIGTRYAEHEVNEVLAAVHPDYAMLRRWLVDEQFMDRGEGRYWRCGGSV